MVRRLSTGGGRIRTIGPSCKKRVVLVETRRLLKGADDRDPSKLQPFSRGTGSSNPSPSSGESATNRRGRLSQGISVGPDNLSRVEIGFVSRLCRSSAD